MEVIKQFWNDESGQGMVEYGLILALISVVAIVALGVLGESVNDKLTDVNDAITTAP